MWVVVVVFWIACGFLGAVIGQAKDAASDGFIAGMLFGPLGVLVAAFIDHRKMCGNCGTRLNGRPNVCPACHVELVWETAPRTRRAPIGNADYIVEVITDGEVTLKGPYSPTGILHQLNIGAVTVESRVQGPADQLTTVDELLRAEGLMNNRMKT